MAVLDFLGQVISSGANIFEGIQDRKFSKDEAQKNRDEQRALGLNTDILDMQARDAQFDFLTENLQDAEAFDFTAPDEGIFAQSRDLASDRIQELGGRQRQAQDERFSAQGTGFSSLSIGAGQRLDQRTQQSVAESDLQFAQAAEQRQLQFQQLQAADKARVLRAGNEKTKILAGFKGADKAQITSAFDV